MDSIDVSTCIWGAKVFSFGWWMGMYGSATPKRHRGFSNNPGTSFLDLGSWKRAFQKQKKVKTVRKYINKDGKLSYCGTKALKDTQSLPQLFYILGTMKETDLSKLHNFFFPICTRSQLPPPLPGSTRRPSLKQFPATLTTSSQVATTSQQWNHSLVKGMGWEHLRVPPSLPGTKPNCIVFWGIYEATPSWMPPNTGGMHFRPLSKFWTKWNPHIWPSHVPAGLDEPHDQHAWFYCFGKMLAKTCKSWICCSKMKSAWPLCWKRVFTVAEAAIQLSHMEPFSNVNHHKKNVNNRNDRNRKNRPFGLRSDCVQLRSNCVRLRSDLCNFYVKITFKITIIFRVLLGMYCFWVFIQIPSNNPMNFPYKRSWFLQNCSMCADGLWRSIPMHAAVVWSIDAFVHIGKKRLWNLV